MNSFSQPELKKAVAYAVARIVEALERLQEPWEVGANRSAESPGLEEQVLFRKAFGIAGPNASPDHLFGSITGLMQSDLARGDPTKGNELALHVLTALGVESPAQSPLLETLSLEMLRLQLAIRAAIAARLEGDHARERTILDDYRKQWLVELGTNDQVALSPKLSEAWSEYRLEKTAGASMAAWGPKTIQLQDATFAEFKDVVSDLRLDQISRAIFAQYLTTIQKLPKNRNKKYKGVLFSKLLEMDIPTTELPSGKTLSEKLIRMRSFLDWCRLTKGVPKSNPAEKMAISANSKSYAPFSDSDLKALFQSDDYCKGLHKKSWRFWVPLIGLYSGAREAEIAQLGVKDILEEEGTWIFVITDFDEGKSVKTEAGIRKVPISSRLIELGFLDYVRTLRGKGYTTLFPDKPKGSLSRAISRWFNQIYRPKVGVVPDPTGRRKVFHSFRHNAINKALKKGQSLYAHVQQVFGHEKSLLGETETYIDSFHVRVT